MWPLLLTSLLSLFPAHADIQFKSSTVGYDGAYGFSRPFVRLLGKTYGITFDSADGVCRHLGYDYALAYKMTHALWGDYPSVHVHASGELAGPQTAPAVLSYIRCTSSETLMMQHLANAEPGTTFGL